MLQGVPGVFHMPGQTIDEVEAGIVRPPNLSDAIREVSLQLLTVLRTAVTEFSAISVDDDRHMNARAATRPKKKEDAIRSAIVSLSSAAERFVGAHSRLRQGIADIYSILPRMGI